MFSMLSLHHWTTVLMVIAALITYVCGSCSWHIDVVQSEFPYLFEPIVQNKLDHIEINLENVTIRNFPNEVQPCMYPYFVRVQVECDGIPSTSTIEALLSVGSYPRITVAYGAYQDQSLSYHTWTDYVFEGALIDMDPNCHVGLCRAVWLVPLPTNEKYLIIHVDVETVGFVKAVSMSRRMITLDGYSQRASADTSYVTSRIGDDADLSMLGLFESHQVLPVHTVREITPIQAMAGFARRPIALISSDFWEHFRVVEIGLGDSAPHCLLGPPIKEVATFPDRIILNTAWGIFEMFADNYATMKESDIGTYRRIELEQCIHHLIVPSYGRQGPRFLSVGQDGKKLYTSNLEFGVPTQLNELVDFTGKSACDHIGQPSCTIIHATFGSVDMGTTYVLLRTTGDESITRYHLLKVDGHGYWDRIMSLDANLTIPHGVSGIERDWINVSGLGGCASEGNHSEDGTCLTLTLTGFSFSGYVSKHLFFWGNNILHSPDNGLTVFILLEYTSQADISPFVVGKDTSFALLNTDQEIWYGEIGDNVYVKKLRPSPGWGRMLRLTGQELEDPSFDSVTISIFFDSLGTLYEFIAFGNSNQTNLRRNRIDQGEILANSMYSFAMVELQHGHEGDGHGGGGGHGEGGHDEGGEEEHHDEEEEEEGDHHGEEEVGEAEEEHHGEEEVGEVEEEHHGEEEVGEAEEEHHGEEEVGEAEEEHHDEEEVGEAEEEHHDEEEVGEAEEEHHGEEEEEEGEEHHEEEEEHHEEEEEEEGHDEGRVSPLLDYECPYSRVNFEILGSSSFERRERYFIGAPKSAESYTHTDKSLMIYQAIVHHLLYEKEYLHTQRDNEIAEDTHNPFRNWYREIDTLQDFYQFLFRNKNMQSGIHIDPDVYYLQPFGNIPEDTKTLPSTIYLDRNEIFEFAISLELGLTHSNVNIEDLHGLVEVSNDYVLGINTKFFEYRLNNSIRYEVVLSDKGALELQAGPGVDLYPASMLIHAWHSTFSCFIKDEDIFKPEGIYTMDVMLGCPPGRKLVFDLQRSIDILEKRFYYDCPVKTENRPCLHYHDFFRPMFKVVDFTTGEASPFTGLFTLTVLGGSHSSEEDIVLFTLEEQQRYNNMDIPGAHIWHPVTKESIINDSIPVYSHLNNTIQWLCQGGSPCSDVPASDYLRSPEYYFLIQMSNFGVDTESTYCRYDLQFVVHVHGMDIGTKTAIIIIMWSFAAIILAVCLFIICNYKERRLWKCLKASCRRPDHTRRVGPVSSDSSEELELEVHYTEGFDHRPVGLSTTSTVIERLVKNDEDYYGFPTDESDELEYTGNMDSRHRIGSLHHRSVSSSIVDRSKT